MPCVGSRMGVVRGGGRLTVSCSCSAFIYTTGLYFCSPCIIYVINLFFMFYNHICIKYNFGAFVPVNKHTIQLR